MQTWRFLKSPNFWRRFVLVLGVGFLALSGFALGAGMIFFLSTGWVLLTNWLHWWNPKLLAFVFALSALSLIGGAVWAYIRLKKRELPVSQEELQTARVECGFQIRSVMENRGIFLRAPKIAGFLALCGCVFWVGKILATFVLSSLHAAKEYLAQWCSQLKEPEVLRFCAAVLLTASLLVWVFGRVKRRKETGTYFPGASETPGQIEETVAYFPRTTKTFGTTRTGLCEELSGTVATASPISAAGGELKPKTGLRQGLSLAVLVVVAFLFGAAAVRMVELVQDKLPTVAIEKTPVPAEKTPQFQPEQAQPSSQKVPAVREAGFAAKESRPVTPAKKPGVPTAKDNQPSKQLVEKGNPVEQQKRMPPPPSWEAIDETIRAFGYHPVNFRPVTVPDGEGGTLTCAIGSNKYGYAAFFWHNDGYVGKEHFTYYWAVDQPVAQGRWIRIYHWLWVRDARNAYEPNSRTLWVAWNPWGNGGLWRTFDTPKWGL